MSRVVSRSGASVKHGAEAWDVANGEQERSVRDARS